MSQRPVGRYNIFGEWLEKYDKRVEKISENPNPMLMKSNLILYQVLRDEAKHGNEFFEAKNPRPVIYHTENAPDRFFASLGYESINLELNADHLTKEQAIRYFELGRSYGFPDNLCDRVQLSHAVGISGDFPPPNIVFAVVGDCDLMSQAMASVARYWDVPLIGVDMGFHEELEMGQEDYFRAMKFAYDQMVEFINLSEEKWPEFIKFDDSKLNEYQDINRQFTLAAGEVFGMIAKARPCPISGRDALRMAPTHVPNDPRVAQYMDMYKKEVKERIEKGQSPLRDNNERMRLYWMTSAPFFEDPFTFLEERGVSSPIYEEGMGVPMRYNVKDYQGAERLFGRAMESPLEEEAALFATHHWGATGNRRTLEVLRRCRDAGIDGLVHFELEGCLSLNNIARITGERAEDELGVKSFYAVDVHCQDMERFNEKEFEESLWDWVQVCLAEKKANSLQKIF